MTKPNSTEIVFLIDRSGSMDSIASAMTVGIEEFINKQKQAPGECRVSLYDFDDEYSVVYEAQTLWTVPKYTLEPRGMTALYDAIGKTVDAVGRRLAAMPEDERPSQVLFVMVSDGGENCSQEFKGEKGKQVIFDRITHQRDKYSWEFIFLGANQNAYEVGTSLGVHASNTVSYTAGAAQASSMMDSLSTNVAAYRTSGLGNMENLYDQKTYNAVTGENLGTDNVAGGAVGQSIPTPAPIALHTFNLDPSLLGQLNSAAVPIIPPGQVITVVSSPPDSQ